MNWPGVEQIPWIYDPVMSAIELFGLRRWRSKLLAGLSGDVLEVGCGTGRNFEYYRSGATVYGCDPALASVRKAHTKRTSARRFLFVASAEAMPLRSERFGVVVSTLVFCSVPNARAGLDEIHRVLKRDGELRMIEHVRANGIPGRVQDLIQPAWTVLAGGCHPNRETETAVKQAGFTIANQDRRERGSLRRLIARLPPEG